METILKHFQHDVIRDYKGGKEIRVKNLDEAVIKCRRIIADQQLAIEIFDTDAQLKSFSVRNK